MAFVISDQALNQRLQRDISHAADERSDALAKLSSGQVFTPKDPRPAERSIAEGLEFRLRGIAASKRNINDAVSLLQTAESGMSEITNMVLRMKELNVSAASTTLSDNERKYLMLEYQGLHDEITRIATTASFNGIPLLNGADPATPEQLILRIDDPFTGEGGSGDNDINTIQFSGLKSVIATAAGLGLQSAASLLANSDGEGVSLSDVQDLLQPSGDDNSPTIYDEAINKLANHRAVYGAMQSRLDRSIDYMDVFQENIAAAKSKIADTDYAEQVSRLTKSTIMMNAATSLLAQSNVNAQMTMSLLGGVLR